MKNKTNKTNIDRGKMVSLRTPQHERLTAIAKKEHRSIRALIERMMDHYENRGEKND